MISTANITMQFGEKPLFENISIKFQNGNRYGLIGANGCGKSTFMKILTSELAATNGTVSVSEGERLGILRQDQFAFEDFRVVDTVIMGHSELWKIKKERDRIYSLPEMSEEDGIKVAELEMQFAEMDGYMAESSASELLLGLDIPESQHYGLMSEIAPGWKLRVLLAQALFSDPEILLLDEPTNNLDINSIRWLEGVLKDRKATMIIISHDRHFLNSVCSHMADIDYGAINVFPGNYDDFMIASTAIQEKMQSDNAKKEAKIKELKHFVSRFSANASKSRQATSRMKQLDKITLDDIKPSSRVSPYIIFNQENKLHRNVIEINNLEKGFDDLKVLKDINLLFEVGERVAVIGQNGIGKTTLLKTLVGKIEPDKGKIKWSENVNVGYYAQDNSNYFEKDMSVLDWMSQFKSEKDDLQAMRSVLGKMLFGKEDIKKNVKSLSGGEKGRMMFGKLMLQKPNVLVMDEPTNHLDMESIEALNLALDNYNGTLIFVSHDREFVSSLSTKVVELKEDGMHYYSGNYEDYLLSMN
ncbi:MAG TPA: ABC-F family ATPase [Gammaproteobacteria bacterium]|jgi:ATPase subunit of ABC transporter with duplicated ATPase domains|nr:ABC-F family ATPase [Gammaproteobacteria bacterium]HAY41859.1 ABC-F family ATPase [Gammaproteobacteria bacterium]|tara:strand:- start:4311 stop:5897 length:1587 start_codon:yes stop_codon:yes gene_type:complete